MKITNVSVSNFRLIIQQCLVVCLICVSSFSSIETSVNSTLISTANQTEPPPITSTTTSQPVSPSPSEPNWLQNVQLVIENNKKEKLAALQSKVDYTNSDFQKKVGDVQNFESNRFNSLETNSPPRRAISVNMNGNGYSFSTIHGGPPVDHHTADESETTQYHPSSPSPKEEQSKSHHHRSDMPSFSKMPDFVVDQWFRDEFDDSSSNLFGDVQTEAPKTVKPLVVPIGSRVHTIRYKDIASDEPGEIVSRHYNKYEPKIIELPSSRPSLPIVFNFHTKSSPIYASQYFPPTSRPKVQYFETNEEPHYTNHVVHKPIYQHLREVIVPYRLHVQEVKPVQEVKETHVPVANSTQQINQSLKEPLHNSSNFSYQYSNSSPELSQPKQQVQSFNKFNQNPLLSAKQYQYHHHNAAPEPEHSTDYQYSAPVPEVPHAQYSSEYHSYTPEVPQSQYSSEYQSHMPEAPQSQYNSEYHSYMPEVPHAQYSNEYHSHVPEVPQSQYNSEYHSHMPEAPQSPYNSEYQSHMPEAPQSPYNSQFYSHMPEEPQHRHNSLYNSHVSDIPQAQYRSEFHSHMPEVPHAQYSNEYHSHAPEVPQPRYHSNYHSYMSESPPSPQYIDNEYHHSHVPEPQQPQHNILYHTHISEVPRPPRHNTVYTHIPAVKQHRQTGYMVVGQQQSASNKKTTKVKPSVSEYSTFMNASPYLDFQSFMPSTHADDQLLYNKPYLYNDSPRFMSYNTFNQYH